MKLVEDGLFLCDCVCGVCMRACVCVHACVCVCAFVSVGLAKL